MYPQLLFVDHYASSVASERQADGARNRELRALLAARRDDRRLAAASLLQSARQRLSLEAREPVCCA